MKNNLLFILGALLIGLTSCSKEGCTDTEALNYDSDAKNNDGSCIYINGCTDTRANNYSSYATTSDGSCLYTGTINFWINNTTKQNLESLGITDLSLYVNGELVKSKTLNEITYASEPSCEQADFEYTTDNLTGEFIGVYLIGNEISYEVKDAASGVVIWSNNSVMIDYGCYNRQLSLL